VTLGPVENVTRSQSSGKSNSISNHPTRACSRAFLFTVIEKGELKSREAGVAVLLSIVYYQR
jgi:hypothetical protein